MRTTKKEIAQHLGNGANASDITVLGFYEVRRDPSVGSPLPVDEERILVKEQMRGPWHRFHYLFRKGWGQIETVHTDREIGYMRGLWSQEIESIS